MKRSEERLLGWLSFGVFLAIVGAIFLITPDLTDEIVAFFKDFKLEQISENFYFPTPQGSHHTLYGAAETFCFAFSAYQILLLFMKILLGANTAQKTETLTSVIFWLVAGFALDMLKSETIEWLLFIAVLVVLGGSLIIIRGIASIISKKQRPKQETAQTTSTTP